MRLRMLLILLPTLLLSGCESLLEMNLFSSLDEPGPLTASEMASASLDEIEARAGTDSFFWQLREYPNAKAALVTNLTDIINDGSTSSADLITASLLFIRVQVEGSGASSAVNNFMTALLPSLMDGGISAVATDAVALQDLLIALFGTDPDTIAENVEILSTLSLALDTLSAEGAIDSAIGGDVVQAALVSTFAIAIMAGATAVTPEAKAESVANLVTASNPAAVLAAEFDAPITLTNHFTEISDIFAAPDTTVPTNYPFLGDLVNLLPFGGA